MSHKHCANIPVVTQHLKIARRSCLPHSCPVLQTLSTEYVENQKKVDAALLKSLDDAVKGYLGTRFSLSSGDRPHLMKF